MALKQAPQNLEAEKSVLGACFLSNNALLMAIETLDETGTASATQIALHHADKKRARGKGFVKSFSVVAEDYADSLATNPQAAYNIHHTVKKLYRDGIFNGILNPLEDNSVDATKKLPNPRYNEDCTNTDGTIYPAFETYPENVSFDE